MDGCSSGLLGPNPLTIHYNSIKDGFNRYLFRGHRGSDRIALDLQPPVQSVPITNVVISNPIHGEVCSIQHYVIKFVSDRSVGFCGYSSLLHQ